MNKTNPAVQSGEVEMPGILGAIAEINRRFAKAGEKYNCPFVPGPNYHICWQCGRTRDEHLAKTEEAAS